MTHPKPGILHVADGEAVAGTADPPGTRRNRRRASLIDPAAFSAAMKRDPRG